MCDYVDVVTVSVVIALARVSSLCALLCARQKRKLFALRLLHKVACSKRGGITEGWLLAKGVPSF